MPEKEQQQKLTSDLREKRDAVQRTHAALEALGKEISALNRPNVKEEEKKTKAESSPALLSLQSAWKETLGLHTKGKIPDEKKWEELRTALGDGKDLAALFVSLKDAIDKDTELSYELADLAGKLGDEKGAAKTYLETFPKPPPEERLWDEIGKVLDTKLDPKLRKTLEGFGLDAETLRILVASFLADMAERLPAIDGFSTSLRFRVALEKARLGDDTGDKKKVEIAMKESFKDPPNLKPLKEIEDPWKVLYKDWLKEKRRPRQPNEASFALAVPTIHDALHPSSRQKPPEVQSPGIFGINGLVKNGKRELLSGQELEVQETKDAKRTTKFKSMGDKQLITINEKTYVMKVKNPQGNVEAAKSFVFSAESSPQELAKVEIVLDGQYRYTFEQVVDAASKGGSPVGTGTGSLIFEQFIA